MKAPPPVRMASDDLWVPKTVDLVDEPHGLQALVWSWGVASTTHTSEPPEGVRVIRLRGTQLLEDFIDPDNSTPDGVLRLARTYGPLRLCEHGLPFTHNANPEVWINRTTGRTLYGPPGPDPTGMGFCQPSQRETVADWLKWIVAIRAAYALRAELARERLPTAHEWSQLHAWDPGMEFYSTHAYGLFHASEGPRQRAIRSGDLRVTPFSVFNYRAWLSDVVNQWLTLGLVHPLLIWGRSESGQLILLGHGLFGHLAYQLAIHMSGGTKPLYRCDACGDWYDPKRKPRAEDRQYCEKAECKRVAHAERVRRYREKRRHGQ